jgi:hypothetical protein
VAVVAMGESILGRLPAHSVVMGKVCRDAVYKVEIFDRFSHPKIAVLDSNTRLSGFVPTESVVGVASNVPSASGLLAGVNSATVVEPMVILMSNEEISVPGSDVPVVAFVVIVPDTV